MPKAIDLTGQVFGRLTAIEPTGERRDGKVVWKCACSCGSFVFVISRSLHRGVTRSCGCLRRETTRITGLSGGAVCPVSPAKLQEMYKDGHSIDELAVMSGCAWETAKQWLLDQNVELRCPSDVKRVTLRRRRASVIKHLDEAREVLVSRIKSGEISSNHLTTPEVRRRALKTYKRTIAARRAKKQAEREQSEAIERALNGDTFK